ncbi:MAG: GTPase ObgE [Candidatus Gracilibacteria bacterium]|nr:GTPase ObgE [Candidatus Gracilibacteria bacterium]
MFIDEVNIKLIAGKGGDGVVTWRREKYIPKGGPRGGNGGNGGNIYLQTNSNLNTLSDFRHKKILMAPEGQKGATNLMQGACGEDLVLNVPIGTIVKNAETGEIIVDLSENNVKFLIAKGGRGGFGNAHFTTSTRQAPSFAEIGDIGETKNVILELKLVADIGIIGIPSAGKSTLIGNITNVKPKIGDYPFTTLVPNLGVLEHKNKTLVLEDVPGLIPGASEGKGLGIEFLKHIERTKVLMHLLDLYRLDQVMQDYKDIRYELKTFSLDLDKKEEIIVFSKGDLLDSEMKDFIVSEFKKKFKKKNIFIISAATGEGIEKLKDYLIDNFSTSIIENENLKFINENELKVIDLRYEEDPKNVELEYLGDYKFRATGKRLEQIVRMTNFDNFEGVMRVYDVLEKLGVIKKVEAKLNAISQNENLDNSFFFEGSETESFSPKIIVANREIPLDKLKYNL